MSHHHHHHHDTGWAEAAAFQYLVRSNPEVARFIGGQLIFIAGAAWALVSLCLLFLAGAIDTGNHWVLRLFGLFVGCGGWFALARVLHGMRWDDLDRKQQRRSRRLSRELATRARLMDRLRSVASEAEMRSLAAVWDDGEPTLAETEHYVQLLNRWHERNPVVYQSQWDVRNESLDRLCLCAPGEDHSDCEPPDMWDVSALRWQVSNERPIPTFLRSNAFGLFAVVAVLAVFLGALCPQVFDADLAADQRSGNQATATQPTSAPGSPAVSSLVSSTTAATRESRSTLVAALGGESFTVRLSGDPRTEVALTHLTVDDSVSNEVTITADATVTGSSGAWPSLQLTAPDGETATAATDGCLVPGSTGNIGWKFYGDPFVDADDLSAVLVTATNGTTACSGK